MIGFTYYKPVVSTATTDISGLAKTNGNIIVGDGSNWVAESGATARTSLGLAIGTNVQAQGDVLDDLNTLEAATADGEFLVATAAGVFAWESGDTARTSLGLGTGDSPALTGLDLSGLTDGNIPVLSASGFADSPLSTNGTEVSFSNTAYFDTEVDNGNSSTADTIDWTAGNKQKSTLTGDCTFTFSPEPSGPCSLALKLIQDGTGSRLVTWPGDVYWPGGTAPTLSTAAAAVDIVSFYYDGANFYGQAALAFAIPA